MAKLWIVNVERKLRCEGEEYVFLVQAETAEEAGQLALDTPAHNKGWWKVASVTNVDVCEKPVHEIAWDYWEK